MAEADSASHHGSIVEEAEEHSMQESPAPRKEEEYPAVKEFQINGIIE